MGKPKFFDDEEITAPSRKVKASYSAASKLLNCLRSKGLIRKGQTPDLEKWSAEFEQLEQNAAPGKIAIVLDWFCSVVNKPGVPCVRSAKSFRTLYAKLSAKMMIGKYGAEILEREVSDQEALILGKIKQWGNWPKTAYDQIPYTVTTSLENYTKFFDKLINFRNRHDGEHTPEMRLLNHLLGTYFISPRLYILGWMRRFWKSFSGWRDWSGTLTPALWTEENERFLGEVFDATVRYCGGYSRWTRLAERLEESK